MMSKDFYTIEEVAELLRVRPGTVRNRLWRGDSTLPPSVRNGRRRLFPVADYVAWKARLPTTT
jgi:excisionase family DNA binding protein